MSKLSAERGPEGLRVAESSLDDGYDIYFLLLDVV